MDAALGDSSTELFAAVNEWDYPASMVDIILMGAQLGKDGADLMPWAIRRPEPVTAEEVEAAHAELAEEIRFTN